MTPINKITSLIDIYHLTGIFFIIFGNIILQIDPYSCTQLFKLLCIGLFEYSDISTTNELN